MSITASRYEQRMSALQRANQIKDDAFAIRRDVAAGRLTVADALDDERADSMTVMSLLMAQPRWGRTRSLNLLQPRWISESRRVRQLTDRQRDEIRQALR